jgi:NAD(P)-dependent dehydrogenase (short-subunit alcohol dehydrogenase family)
MTLELNGRKVVVIGGTRDLGRTLGEAVSNKGTSMGSGYVSGRATSTN